ncbi:MAG: tRNA (adenosine(37)-N6)-threonylcarbamoyltransferase complex dimerization subunit type 1 TsaB [Chloroflexi bacterium]|nr:tRNA (adenosine(37)-N6)-threonylcarbamoyltransferase complex dimerization subunit type 1 TsaB [Chloroflexota bacterium]
MLLAIDTATRWASLALYDEAGIAAEYSWRCSAQHTRQVLPAIDHMLRATQTSVSDISALAVAQGPGSFTGLRIGLSIAKGLSLARDLPIVAIPTLDITAYAAGDPGCPLIAVLEMRRGRIVTAQYRFEEGEPVVEGEVVIRQAGTWQPPTDEPILVTGEISSELARRLLQLPGGEQIAVASQATTVRRAGFLAELAWLRLERGEPPAADELAPIYLQQPAAGAPEG